MSDPFSSVVLTAFLSVSHVGDGQGFPHTPNSAYVCGYDKALYELKQRGAVDVVFVPGTESRFRMRAIDIKGDTAGEVRAGQVEDRQLRFFADNETEQTFYFSVIIEDIDTGALLECDPQVVCRPWNW